MCLAIPGIVTNINKKKAYIKYGKETKPALIGDEKVVKGDYVMVQMGIIVKVLSRKEVEDYYKIMKIT